MSKHLNQSLFEVPPCIFPLVLSLTLGSNGSVSCKYCLPPSSRRSRLVNTFKFLKGKKIVGRYYPWIKTFNFFFKFVTSSGVVFTKEELIEMKKFNKGPLKFKVDQDCRWFYLSNVIGESSEVAYTDEEMNQYMLACEGVFQTLRGFTISVGSPKRLVRFMKNQAPAIILDDPDVAKRLIVEIVNHCEDLFFERKPTKIDDNPFKILATFASCRGDFGLVQARYMKRCLPHYRDYPPLQGYVDRVSEPPHGDPLEEDRFHDWVEDYFSMRGNVPSVLTIAPSNSSCMEYTRSMGGASSGYKKIIDYQIMRIRGEYTSDADKWSKDNVFVQYILTENSVGCGRSMPDAPPGEPPGYQLEKPQDRLTHDFFSKKAGDLKKIFGDFTKGKSYSDFVEGIHGRKVKKNVKDRLVPGWFRMVSTNRKSSELNSRPRSIGGNPTIVESRIQFPSVPFRLEKDFPRNRHSWMVARARSVLLIAGCLNLLSRRISPVVATVIRDRGGKHRIPTMTWIPALVCASILRSAVDGYTRHDGKMKYCFGETPRGDIPGYKPGTLLRSLDLNKATDLHSYRLTRGIYEKIFPMLQSKLNLPKSFLQITLDSLLPINNTRPIFKRIGPPGHIEPVVGYRTEPDPFWVKIHCTKPLLYKGIGLDILPQVKKAESVTRDIFSYEEIDRRILAFENVYLEFENFSLRPLGRACKGPPMGEPLSFPVMPLLTIYTYEKTHRDFEGKHLLCCGDDALGRTTKSLSQRWSQALEQLGAEVNLSKDAIHRDKSVFIEIVCKDGEPIGLPFAPLFSVPTSKWEVNFMTLSGVIGDLLQRVKGSRRLARRLTINSRIFREVSALRKRGVPVTLPRFACGLGLDLPSLRGPHFYYRQCNRYENSLKPGDPLDPSTSVCWLPKHKSLISVRKSAFEEIKYSIDPQQGDVDSRWSVSTAVGQRCASDFSLGALSGTALLFKDKACPRGEEMIKIVRSFAGRKFQSAPDRSLDQIEQSYLHKKDFPIPDYTAQEADNLALGVSDFTGAYHYYHMFQWHEL